VFRLMLYLRAKLNEDMLENTGSVFDIGTAISLSWHR